MRSHGSAMRRKLTARRPRLRIGLRTPWSQAGSAQWIRWRCRLRMRGQDRIFEFEAPCFNRTQVMYNASNRWTCHDEDHLGEDPRGNVLGDARERAAYLDRSPHTMDAEEQSVLGAFPSLRGAVVAGRSRGADSSRAVGCASPGADSLWIVSSLAGAPVVVLPRSMARRSRPGRVEQPALAGSDSGVWVFGYTTRSAVVRDRGRRAVRPRSAQPAIAPTPLSRGSGPCRAHERLGRGSRMRCGADPRAARRRGPLLAPSVTAEPGLAGTRARAHYRDLPTARAGRSSSVGPSASHVHLYRRRYSGSPAGMAGLPVM